MKNRTSYISRFIVGALLLQIPLQSMADHPNEGAFTLEQLIKEAEAQNFEIKEAESTYKSSQSQADAKYGKFLPRLSVEGGPQTTKFDDDKNSGTTLYGKADWNLYRGGLDQDNFEKSRIQRDLDQKKFEASKSKVIRDVSRNFHELSFLLESSALKEKALQLNQEQMKLAKLKKNSGFTSSADVIEFELREATLTSDLKMISQLNTEKSRELSVLLGRKDLSSSILVKGHLAKETPSISKEDILKRLRQSNIEIVQANAEAQLSQKDAAIAKSGFLPSVDLEAKYGKIANEERVFSENNNYSLMLKISVPLFSGLETLNETRAARSSVAAKEASATRKTLTGQADAENLLSQLTTISERINLEEKNLSKSEEYYKITLGEYRRGVKNSPDMVGASERLLEAKIRNLEYRKDFYLTKLKIYELVSSDPMRETKL
ncbi:MAG: TolC family protein [Bdellovibrionales bacterium]|nr:TolC family protein [Bdellovibrionales bacterium]